MLTIIYLAMAPVDNNESYGKIYWTISDTASRANNNFLLFKVVWATN